MRFVSRHQEAPGCFAAGRAFRGSGFRLRSRLRRLFAPLTTPIPSPSFILFLLRSAIFSVNLYFPVAAGWPLEPPWLIVDRIRRDGQRARKLKSLHFLWTGFATPVGNLLFPPSVAASAHFLPPPVAGFQKLLRHCSQFLKTFASFRILSTPL